MVEQTSRRVLISVSDHNGGEETAEILGPNGIEYVQLPAGTSWDEALVQLGLERPQSDDYTRALELVPGPEIIWAPGLREEVIGRLTEELLEENP